MAEETKENEERVKLFIGQVPKHMTETQLLALFQEFSIVDEVNIIKDKITRASRGFFISSSVFSVFLVKFRFFFCLSFLCFSVSRILGGFLQIRVISS